MKSGVVEKDVVEVRELDWFSREDVKSLGHFDFILGSELWFDEDLLAPLNEVLKILTTINPKAVVLMGYQDRLLVDDHDISSAFEKHFHVVLIPSRIQNFVSS